MQGPSERRDRVKYWYPIAFFGILIAGLLFSACTGTSPAVPTTATPVATAVVTVTPTAVTDPYPDALSLKQYATFGSADMIGQATVYAYEIKPDYTWTSPSWKSPYGQGAVSAPLDVQRGYNTEKPREGNTFLFVYIRVMNPGKNAVVAPSAKQFVLDSNGTIYQYSPVYDAGVTIDKVSGTQYDYQIGRGGTAGYIQPGDSNRAEGYLIYELPATFSPERTYVVSNLDFQTRAVWRLSK
jgi:hypothetical protein